MIVIELLSYHEVLECLREEANAVIVFVLRVKGSS